MTKKFETGAAPVSKYAAKKFNRAEAVKPAVVNQEEQVAVAVKEEDENPKAKKFFKKPFKRNFNGVGIENFPEHQIQIALLIKNNAEIRRFTALGIINYLMQKGELKGDSRYVSFKWNKFAVKSNGLMREYSYNEPFFMNALVASFTSFSASAQKTIDNFCRKEMSISVDRAVDVEEVQNIIELNNQYQDSKVEVETETVQ